MSWVLVSVVGDSTVTLAGAVAETLPEASAAPASDESAIAMAALRRPMRMFIGSPFDLSNRLNELGELVNSAGCAVCPIPIWDTRPSLHGFTASPGPP